MAEDHGMSMPLSRDVGSALHHQLSTVLRSTITSGRYGIGEFVPSEHELMAMYGVSRATVRRALLTLESEHLLDRRAGKGTRVLARPPLTTGTTIDQHIRYLERNAAVTTVSVLAFEDVQAPADVARALRLHDPATVLRIVRVRYSGDTPQRYMINYLEAAVGDRLSRDELRTTTLIEALRRIGRIVRHAEDEIGATLADATIASALQLRVGDPLLEMTRTMFDEDRRPVAFQWTVTSPAVFKLRVVISGDANETILPTADLGTLAPIGHS